MAGITLDPRTGEVHRDGRSVPLLTREVILLAALMRHPGEFLSPDQCEQVRIRADLASGHDVRYTLHCLQDALDRPFGRATFVDIPTVGIMLLETPGEPS